MCHDEDSSEPRRERRRDPRAPVALAIGLGTSGGPGLDRVYGSTARLPDCDGHECRQEVVVIGSAKSRDDSQLGTWTSDIVICTNGEPANLDSGVLRQARRAEHPRSSFRSAASTTRTHSLTFESGLALDTDEIFFAIGQYPADDLGAQLHCERDAGGHIIVDESYHTPVRHCFAAGDIVPGPQLAVAAAADGAIAALAIHKSLVPAERKLEKLERED